MASIKGNLRFTEPCREGLRAASSSNFGLQNDYVFDWTILKYQQSQMVAPPNRALNSKTENGIIEMAKEASNGGSHITTKLPPEPSPLRRAKFFKVIVADNYFTGSKENLRRWIGHPRFELIRHVWICFSTRDRCGFYEKSRVKKA